jgi:hypothetical protein
LEGYKYPELPKGVKIAEFDLRKLRSLWERVKGYDHLFVRDGTHNFDYFSKALTSGENNLPSIVLEVPNGILYAKNISIGHKADGHLIFFDHKLTGKEELIRDCLVWIFLVADLERFAVLLPPYCGAIKRFLVRKMGFTKEGTLRKLVKHHGSFIDMDLFSILRDEVLQEEKNGWK